MRRYVALTLGLVLAGVAVGSHAQEGKGGVEPTPEMKRLAFMVGKFTGTDRQFSGEKVTDETTLHVETSWMPGGRQILMRARYEKPGLPEALLIMTFDPQAQEYHGWTFLSSAAMPLEFRGKFDGADLVLAVQPGRSHASIQAWSVSKKPADTQSVLDYVMPDGPAARGGLRGGDAITHIDGKSLRGLGEADVSALLLGREGTPVRLRVIRADRARELTLTRRLPPDQSSRTTGKPRPGGGYSEVDEVKVDGKWEKVAERVFTPKK